MTTAEHIVAECDKIRELLLQKNAAYGDAAVNPVRCFSKASPEEQINVRLDDKLSRLMRGASAGEDTETDLLGYLVLKRVNRAVQEKKAQEAVAKAFPAPSAAPVVEKPVDPGAGYRLLGPDECPKTGDEFLDGYGWTLTGFQDGNTLTVARTNEIYRRKVDPNTDDGYRLLAHGEEIKSGDQIGYGPKNSNFASKGVDWEDVRFAGGMVNTRDSIFVYRRKLDTPVAKPALAGYRLLGLDEVLEKGDQVGYSPEHPQFEYKSYDWELLYESEIGQTAKSHRSKTSTPHLIYRRKLEAFLPPSRGTRLTSPVE